MGNGAIGSASSHRAHPRLYNAHPGYTVIAGKLTMKRQNVMWMLLAPAIAVVVMFLAEPVRAEVLEQMKTVASTTVHYKIVLPDGYDPAKAYPAILAFGGGPQDMSSVDNILNRNFRAEAEKRGYIVVVLQRPTATCSSRMETASSPSF